jgi:hypothetical protein
LKSPVQNHKEFEDGCVGRSGDDFLEKRMFVAVFNWAIPPYTAESKKDMLESPMVI